MGRKKLYDERAIVSCVKGTFKRIKRVLRKHEVRTEFMRRAIEDQIQLRESEGAKSAGA